MHDHCARSGLSEVGSGGKPGVQILAVYTYRETVIFARFLRARATLIIRRRAKGKDKPVERQIFMKLRA